MKNKINIIIFTTAFLIISLMAFLKPDTEISDTELRRLNQKPKFSMDGVLSGEYMSSFEKAALDQFPFREGFRRIKSYVYLYALNQSDNNGIYVENGYASKMEYPYNDGNVRYALSRFENIYNKYLKDSDAKCYLSIIPDKNYFLSAEHGALSIDYEKLISEATTSMEYAKYIDILSCLSIEDYYKTDTHWNQVNILPVAEKILNEMNATSDVNYETVTIDKPFYGVYYGQAALPLSPDEMSYLVNEDILNASVTDRQNGKEISVYDESKFDSRAPYDLFLGGSLSLISINKVNAGNLDGDTSNSAISDIEALDTENFDSETSFENGESSGASDRHLIVFRDSFGSSLIPLFISSYNHIDVVDIRYLSGDRLGEYIDFENADVLFLYSASVLNNGNVIK